MVKQSLSSRKEAFIQEKSIFNAIGEKAGLVKCVGWYQSHEQLSEHWEICNNLVLELGDQDLYSTFQKENPPVALIEVKAFWQSMFQVAEALSSLQIHTPYDGITFHV